MNYRAIFYILGIFWSGFGFLMLVPMMVSLIYGEGQTARSFLEGFALSVIAGAFTINMMRGSDMSLGHKDAFILTLLTWLTVTILGSVPLFIAVHISPVDAFFETMSGITTTGATVFSGLDSMAKGVLLWRSMLQWIGGMGIVVLAVAVLPFLGIGGLQLYKSEMPGVTKDKLQPRIKETAKILWIVYLVLTILCAAAYSVAGMSTFDAICHAFSTVATGGFSTHDLSLGYFDSVSIEIICMVFMILGATNFSLHYLFLTSSGRIIYAKDIEFKVFIFTVFVASVCLGMVLDFQPDVSNGEAYRGAFFQMVSILTTTGFTTADYTLWPHFGVLLIMVLMFWGGCTGSTSGGFKFMRVIIAALQGYRELKRLIHPRGVVQVKLNNRTVSDEVLQAVWSFIALFLISVIVLTLILTMLGLDYVTALSAVGASITSFGPAMGELGPAGNYAALSDPIKLVLCFSMLLGRLELMTLLVLFVPAFWRK